MSLCLDVGRDVKCNGRQCGDHDANIIGVADDRCQVGDGVKWENKIPERAVDDPFRPFGRSRALRRVVKIERLFERTPAYRPGLWAQLEPETPGRVFALKPGSVHRG